MGRMASSNSDRVREMESSCSPQRRPRVVSSSALRASWRPERLCGQAPQLPRAALHRSQPAAEPRAGDRSRLPRVGCLPRWRAPERDPRWLKDRDVEGAAAQVKHGIGPLAALLESVGDGRRGGLIEEAQDLKSREAARVPGGLAPSVIKQRGRRSRLRSPRRRGTPPRWCAGSAGSPPRPPRG